MQFFNNLKIGTKIMVGYLLALILMAFVGGTALVQFNQTDRVVADLADNLAKDQHLADQIVGQIWTTRFFALRYINQQQPEDLAQYQQERANFEALLATADLEITSPERVEMLVQIEAGIATYETSFMEVTQLMDDRDIILKEILDIEGPLAENKLEVLRESAFTDSDVSAAFYAAEAQRALILMRLDAFKYLRHGDPIWIEKFNERYANAESALQSLDDELQNPTRRQLAAEAEAAIDKYATGFTSLQTGYTRQNQIIVEQLNVIGPEVRRTGTAMSDSVASDFAATKTAAQTLIAETRSVLWLAMVVAIIVTLSLGWFISRNITKPVRAVTQAAIRLASGNLAQIIEVNSRDEMGQMAHAFREMIAYLQGMAQAAGRLAEGDLTATVTPQSEQDALGNAFSQMIDNLRHLIGQVSDNAKQVNAASGQLASTADQAGQATHQIAATIQQVTEGTQQQTESVTATAETIGQVSLAVEGVAKGAQEQASAVAKSVNLTTHITKSIEQVTHNAQTGANGAAEAARTAQSGANVVTEMSQGMASIRTKVGLSAQKVAEMGERSDQIGTIIGVIDDIASQTNLLALNAAIEAARAGEHGKGFAVVADEVRQLAEKSAAATGEIGELIKDIQRTVTEAVQAMNDGASEVEVGVERVQQSGEALDNILTAVKSVKGQVESIADAAEQVKGASTELSQAMDTVSAVVEENTASTEEMAASAMEVNEAVGSIAAVSEENSAAVEEVSAATEEMSAQVQEVSDSAQSLQHLAQGLQEVVGQFKLSIKSDANDVTENIEVFKQSHLDWVHRVEAMLAGEGIFEPQAHTECALGRWYQTRGKLEFGHHPEFEAIDEPHQTLHQLLFSIYVAYQKGDIATAKTLLAQLEQISQQVVDTLTHLQQVKWQEPIQQTPPVATPLPEKVAETLKPLPLHTNGYH